jgi:hypothetical protein
VIDLTIVLFVVSAVCIPLLYGATLPAEPRHVRCLRNIDRLERELFPEWFEEQDDPGEVRFEPGARWQVDPTFELCHHLIPHGVADTPKDVFAE